jgi:hypothetical protein
MCDRVFRDEGLADDVGAATSTDDPASTASSARIWKSSSAKP